MKKYEKAKLEYVELETKDIMNASSTWGEGGNPEPGIGGDAGDNVM